MPPITPNAITGWPVVLVVDARDPVALGRWWLEALRWVVVNEDPAESFRRNIWINPFWEDDVHEVVELMGADRVIFGSDWPHIEGMPKPLDYAAEHRNQIDVRIRLNEAAAESSRRSAEQRNALLA